MHGADYENSLARLEAQMEVLMEKTSKIERGIYGNGATGLKERVSNLEIKFLIFGALVTPVTIYALKQLLFG